MATRRTRRGPVGEPDGHRGPADDSSGNSSRPARRRAGLADPEADEADPEAIARQICLRLLAVAPKTRAQLEAALRRRGVPEEASEAVLGRFAEVKLIDDATFANAWVESRHHGRGLSGRALAAELRSRGVASGDIQAAVARLDPEQEVETARSLVAARLAATRGLPAQARARRMIGALARKGYSPALAYRLTREALEQEGLDLAGAGLDLGDAPDEPADEAADG
ncbi:MAG TPA: regulatory protein RecX [Streptosporangiaceae bacterium]|nr:regulatory protein RecX [Streptosporangiaceae bacterium]